MSPSSQPVPREIPGKVSAKLIRSLATLAVLAILVLLLVWGFWATQWTTLTTNNNVRDALVTASVTAETATYSIPQGAQRDYPVCIGFQTSGSSTGCAVSASTPTHILNSPVSNQSTTIDDYVVFSITNPNGSALIVWYSGPKGNLTQDCNGAYPAGEITCTYEPSPTGARLTLGSTFFKTPTPGNYSIHLLSTQCTQTPNCTTTTAVGSLTLATATLTYNRPYWAYGLATEILAGASIATTVAYSAIASYSSVKRRSKQHHGRDIPPSRPFD